MVQPLELHEMNFLELCAKLRLSEEEFEDWMVSLGLIHGSTMCDHCRLMMCDHCGMTNFWLFLHFIFGLKNISFKLARRLASCLDLLIAMWRHTQFMAIKYFA
jgi:hypothetical protein